MPEPIRFYNTLARAVEGLQPLSDSAVTIYTCGPTVYDYAHIGNFRTFIFEDILVKTLRHFGYQVNRVMNITDVGHLVGDEDQGEDKLEVGAARDGITAWDVAKKYQDAFLSDLAKLHIEIPATLIKATDTIQEQIKFIQELEAKGFTYTTEDGVYFESTKVADYGKLAKLDIDGLQAGSRVAMQGKKHPTDFALWKLSEKPGERHMEWQSPWGVGFPGWHIECSAIIRQSLGDSIDIHCGGVDHIPVHHTNEIAQSESVTDHPLAQIWMHGEFLLVDGGKMSKSLQNTFTLADLEKRNYDPAAFRLFCYSASYRSKLNFTWEGLSTAADQLEKLRATFQASEVGESTPAVKTYLTQIDTALADDLNIPVVLAVVWEAARSALSPAEKRAFLENIDQILSLNLEKSTEELVIPQALQNLLTEREEARQTKNWQQADVLRQQIENAGFQVKDTPEGQKIEQKRTV
jgi:cysteinyl-tRNA synthetase